MYDNIESMLLDRQSELYLSIKQKSIDELNLPINVGNSIIGFGKILDFYMFWISKKRGTVCFNARKEFTRSRMDNSVKIEFVLENQNAIFDAIDKIYNSYLDSNTNGKFGQEIQRIEDKKSVRATIAKNKEKSPYIELLWNDVTVSTFERAEQSCQSDDIDSDKIEQFRASGQRLIELFDDILCIMESKYYPSLSRKISVYREYIESDKRTLADIAPKYDISRERVRQLVKRVDEHIFGYFTKMMLYENAEFNKCVEQLTAVFETADYNMIHLIGYGLTELGNRKKCAIFNMLFGNDFSQRLMEESQVLTEHVQVQNNLIEKRKDILEAWDFYQSKICYPSSLSVKSFSPVESYKKEKSFKFEKRLYEKLKKFEPLIGIIENPDIVYYSTSKTDHRPHFLLRLPDESCVLVLVLPTLNMAYIYNIQRYNELHRFCKEHGYGYLIIDDRENSIYDIRNRVVDQELVDCLNTVLNNQTMIVWRNIKDIKLTRQVSNADIAAYVLQNKLHFTMEPFCIKRRDKTYLD